MNFFVTFSFFKLMFISIANHFISVLTFLLPSLLKWGRSSVNLTLFQIILTFPSHLFVFLSQLIKRTFLSVLLLLFLRMYDWTPDFRLDLCIMWSSTFLFMFYWWKWFQVWRKNVCLRISVIFLLSWNGLFNVVYSLMWSFFFFCFFCFFFFS